MGRHPRRHWAEASAQLRRGVLVGEAEGCAGDGQCEGVFGVCVWGYLSYGPAGGREELPRSCHPPALGECGGTRQPRTTTRPLMATSRLSNQCDQETRAERPPVAKRDCGVGGILPNTIDLIPYQEASTSQLVNIWHWLSSGRRNGDWTHNLWSKQMLSYSWCLWTSVDRLLRSTHIYRDGGGPLQLKTSRGATGPSFKYRALVI